jgi:hypothetical protein
MGYQAEPGNQESKLTGIAVSLSHDNPINAARFVTPAKAGVQGISESLDSGLRRNDD